MGEGIDEAFVRRAIELADLAAVRVALFQATHDPEVEALGPVPQLSEADRNRLITKAVDHLLSGAASAPLANWVSRAYESEADWRGLQLAGDPQAAIGLQQGLVQRALGVPDTPEGIQVWFGSHPTALQRIGLALRAEQQG